MIKHSRKEVPCHAKLGGSLGSLFTCHVEHSARWGKIKWSEIKWKKVIFSWPEKEKLSRKTAFCSSLHFTSLHLCAYPVWLICQVYKNSNKRGTYSCQPWESRQKAIFPSSVKINADKIILVWASNKCWIYNFH